MNADEVRILRGAMAERYPDAPDDDLVTEAWINALAEDDLGEMATALASWFGRMPQRVPTIADLRDEPRVTTPGASRTMRLARAAYEAECARQGKRPRMDLFGGAP